MRKLNVIITACILVLFIIHGVFGALLLTGSGSTALKPVAWTAAGLTVVHIVISLKLTFDTLKIQKQTGVSYFKENRLFWARRISGFAVMVLLVFHMTAFGYSKGGFYRLKVFDDIKLITQILFIAALGTHVVSNAKPMLISFGIKSLRPRTADILIVLSVLLFCMAAAIVIYYLKWNAF